MVEKKRGTRGRRPKKTGEAGGDELALTRARVVSTAIEILDRAGPAGLTMRGLAEALGSGVMSLYWHVKSKEDVLDLALDTVLEYRAPAGGSEQDWRGQVTSMLEDWRAIMLRHPWSATLLPSRTLGPNTLVRLESLSQGLSKAGLSDADINAAIWSLWNYVMGATVTRASFGPPDADRAASLQRLAELGARFPAIERSRLLLDDDWDGTFKKGLGFLLDGLAAQH